jgi:hypothetical protein
MHSLRYSIVGFIALVLMAVLSAGAMAQDPDMVPDQDADYGEFEEALRPNGEWIDHPQFGLVWMPYIQEQEPDWRPYSRGQWQLTEDYGWYWDSDEPWGWATYHYGRWYFDPDHGWIWVPGTLWGPAWVAWRESDDTIGWTPLPPDADWLPGEGIVYRNGYYLDGPRYAGLWVFVGVSALLAPRVYQHFYPRSRNAYFIGRSRNVTTYRFTNARVFNLGINPRTVERRIGRPVAVVPVRPVDTPRGTRWGGGPRNFVGVYRPAIVPRSDGRPSTRPPFAGQREPARTTPPTFDPRRIEPRAPDRDRGLPRPDGGREPWRDRARVPDAPLPPRSGPSNVDPRFGSRTPEAGRPPEAGPPVRNFDRGNERRDSGRGEERRREAAPPPPPRSTGGAGSFNPPPSARANAPPQVRQPPPRQEGSGGGGAGSRGGDQRKENRREGDRRPEQAGSSSRP